MVTTATHALRQVSFSKALPYVRDACAAFAVLRTVDDVVQRVFSEEKALFISMGLSFACELIAFFKYRNVAVGLVAAAWAVAKVVQVSTASTKTSSLQPVTVGALLPGVWVPVRPVSDTRRGQVQQVTQALGQGTQGVMITGIQSSEFAQIFAMIATADVPGYHLSSWYLTDATELEIERLVTYFNAMGKKVLYIEEPVLLLRNNSELWPLFTNLDEETQIVCLTEQEGWENNQNIRIHNCLKSFKSLKLLPLAQTECQQECSLLPVGQACEGQALPVAVECAFLLFQRGGEEYLFTKDLLERAFVENQRTTVERVWEVFVPMYHSYVDSIRAADAYKSVPRSITALNQIAQTIRGKYHENLPLEAPQALVTPTFLSNLSEIDEDLGNIPVEPQYTQRLDQALRGGYRNALITAPSGAGKTTLVKWAAKHHFRDKVVYALNLDALLAGCSLVGILEGRITQLFNFLSQSPNAILFIDEIHRVMGAGAAEGNPMGTLAQAMKDPLESKAFSVIGATTDQEYRQWMTGDAAFVRRFNQVELLPPTDQYVIEIYKHYIRSEAFKALNENYSITDNELGQMLGRLKRVPSNISLIDQGKKELDRLAMNAPVNLS